MLPASNICSYIASERSSESPGARWAPAAERPQAGKKLSYSRGVSKEEPTTEELRRKQHERTTDEHRAITRSMTADEERQHRRRAEKSAYLERMLAERERSEHGGDRD